MSHGGGIELHEEHEEHVNHEAWVIPYADLLTLLMAMFIALFAMSTVDMSKFEALAIGFNEALGGGKLDAGIGGAGHATSPVVGAGNGNGPFSGGTLSPQDGTGVADKLARILDAAAAQTAAKQRQQQALTGIAEEIERAARERGFEESLNLELEGRGLVVTLVTDKILFDSGKADLRAEGRELLTIVATSLAHVNNPVLVNGYTDNVPINTALFPSNRYLSAYRAARVADFFESLGIDASRLRPAGLGELYPVASNATAEGRARNRRVEIIVESKLVSQTLEEAGLDDTPAAPAPTTAPIVPVTPVAPDVTGARPDLSPGLGAH